MSDLRETSRDWSRLSWREMTWGERIQAVLCWIAAGIVGVAMFFGAIYVLGMMIDAQSYRAEERHRCLQQATNGLEIEECKR